MNTQLLNLKEEYWGGENPVQYVLPLKCKEIYWDNDKPLIIDALKIAPENMNKETLVQVIREMDRRLMQLWDKVSYEKEKGYINYPNCIKD